MIMFSRRARLKHGDGGPISRRPKRIKTHHTAEDQVIREFQDILGHLRGGGDISGGPVVEYDDAAEAAGQTLPDLNDQPEDTLPEADLRSVPHDPSLQALWIAREIKKLAVYNEEHVDHNQGKSLSITPPITPTIDVNASSHHYRAHGSTSKSFAESWRSSGRKRRQTNKAKDSHLIDLDIENEPVTGASANGNPSDGLNTISALVTNERIHHTLSHSLNLGPGNFEKRNAFGVQFLQSMAADTIPPDPGPAAKLKHSLWRSRNHVPIISALHILAGFKEVVQAIDIAFQGRLDWWTPLSKRENFWKDVAHPNGDARNYHDNLISSPQHHVDRKGKMKDKRNPFNKRIETDHGNSGTPNLPLSFVPEGFPKLLPKITTNVNVPIQNEQASFVENFQPESDIDDPFASAPPVSRQFTAIDPARSARAISALKGATEILEDMAYGALKTFFLPPPTGPQNDQYLTPYRVPAPNTYVTPYANPPQAQPHHIIPDPTAFEQPAMAPQILKSSATEMVGSHEGSYSFNEHPKEREYVSDKGKGKGKEKPQERPIPPYNVLETREIEKVSETPTAPGPISSKQLEQEDDEDFTQIDSFLALAAGGESDSDSEIDRDQTISREMTPAARPPGDPEVDSAIQGIIFELTTNQNRGHGLGFLNPQTHLYQISNAQRFAEGLRTHVNNARIEVNCVVSADHSRALQTFYDAVIKRISNPYLEGALPQYSNIVYHKGRAYQAIPGPAHPMFHQHSTLPPPPPQSSEMMLPSPNSLPPPTAFPPPSLLPFPGPLPYPGPLTHSGPLPHPGPVPTPSYMPQAGHLPPPGLFPQPGLLPPPGMMPMKLPIDPLPRVSSSRPSSSKGPTKRIRTFRFKPSKSRAASAPNQSASTLQGFQPSSFQRPVVFPDNFGMENNQPPPGSEEQRKRKRKLHQEIPP